MTEWMFYFSAQYDSVCVCVCVWRRPYVTDPGPLRWVRKRQCLPGPFKVMAVQRGGLTEMEGEDLGISLHRFHFSVCLTLALCVFLHLFPLCCLSLPFITTASLCVAPGESAPGSWCDTVMRRDMVIQQFQPQGHICSLSFLYLSASCIALLFSVYLMRMYSAVAWVPVRIYHLCFINTHQTVHCFDCGLLDMSHCRGFCWLLVTVTKLPCS